MDKSAIALSGQKNAQPRVAQIHSIPIAETSGIWGVLASFGPLATQLDLRDRFGLWSYVPLREYRNVYRGKPNGWLQSPLFPGYVFARGDESAIADARRARMVYGPPVPVPSQIRLTDELAAVEKMLALDPRAEYAESFIPGQKVRILSGDFEGMEGTIIYRDKRSLFAVGLTMLGGAVMTDVSAELMELVTP